MQSSLGVATQPNDVISCGPAAGPAAVAIDNSRCPASSGLSELRCVMTQTVGLTRTTIVKTAEMYTVIACLLTYFINIGKRFHGFNKGLQKVKKINSFLFLSMFIIFIGVCSVHWVHVHPPGRGGNLGVIYRKKV